MEIKVSSHSSHTMSPTTRIHQAGDIPVNEGITASTELMEPKTPNKTTPSSTPEPHLAQTRFPHPPPAHLHWFLAPRVEPLPKALL